MKGKGSKWIFALAIGLSSCVSDPGSSNLRSTGKVTGAIIDITHARAISLVAQNNLAFSNRLVRDILFEDVSEGYRFTRVGTFHDSLSLSVYRENGATRAAILSGLPITFEKKDDETYTGMSSAFGEFDIAEHDFSKIAAAFQALDVCAFTSDSIDLGSTDGEAWTYEVVKDGRYCFAWASSPDGEGFLDPVKLMVSVFEIEPDLGVTLQ